MRGREPPLIGITAYREHTRWGPWHERADLLTSAYADAVAAAGGVPLLLPVASASVEGGSLAVVDSVHGLLLSGGPDVDPALYRREREPETDEPRTERDGWESSLAREAVRRALPLLGICRGLQLLNVALGGTLVQHLPDSSRVRHRPTDGDFAVHAVVTAPGTRIGEIIGPRADVLSHHHQAIDGLAPQLVATAWADDGVIEAAEKLGAGWTLAVQWHPEERGGAGLFEAFVAAAAAHRDAPDPAPARV